MKKIILILVLVLSTVVVFSNFRLKNATLANGTYWIEYNPSLPQAFRNEFSWVIFDMSPNGYVIGAPVFANGGLSTGFNQTPLQNGVCEMGYGQSSNPNRGGVTDDYTNSGQYTEFDILYTSNFAFTWGSGFNNTVDRATVMRHELGHGVGLDHTSVSSRLMAATVSPGDIKNIGNDEIAGYECIYRNFCNGQEGGSGNIELSTDMSFSDNFEILKWNVETDKNTLVGFNILAKTDNGELVTVNQSLIEYDAEKDSYNFLLGKENTYKKYYVEVVGDDQTDMRMFKF